VFSFSFGGPAAGDAETPASTRGHWTHDSRKPEDKTKLDQEFQTKQKQLADKLAKEQKTGNRPYLIAKGNN